MAVTFEAVDDDATFATYAPTHPPVRIMPRGRHLAPAALRVLPRGHLLDACAARALALWPRLSLAALAKTHGDPKRIARLVSRRSSEPPEVIVAMLTGEPIRPEPSTSRCSIEEDLAEAT